MALIRSTVELGADPPEDTSSVWIWNSRVVVNGVAKDRSRLTHGNTLRIGSVEMQVDMPVMEIAAPDFDVSFEDEEAPTAKVSEAVAYDRESESATSNPSSTIDAPDPTDQTDSIAESDESRPGRDADSSAPAEARDAQSSDPSSHPPTAALSDKDAPPSASTSEGQVNLANEKRHTPPASTRSVTFKFDSGDPDDVDLSQAEIDEMTQTSPLENVMGNVDLEGELESESESVTETNENENENETQAADGEEVTDPATTDADSDPSLLEGGLYADKHWRWTNSRAISVLRRILDFDPGLNIYQCDIKHIKSVEIEEYSLRWFKKQKSVVYLVSQLDENEINSLVRSKRWDERIGHPQAVTMFLALSPKRIVREFFDSIQACILISEDLELLRDSETLEH